MNRLRLATLFADVPQQTGPSVPWVVLIVTAVVIVVAAAVIVLVRWARRADEREAQSQSSERRDRSEGAGTP